MSTVIVTGGTGFVGSAVIARLLADGHSVRMTTRDRDRAETLVGRHPLLTLLDVPDFNVMTSDWAGLLQGVDVVLHLAGHTSVKSAHAFDKVNAVATARLAQAAVQCEVRRLVFLSTIGVNGRETTNLPFTEKDLPKPHDAYSVSKLKAELSIGEAVEHTRVQAIILRAPLIYGPHCRGKFLRLLKAVQKGLPLPLRGARNRRSFIYIHNLVEALLASCFHPRENGGTFLVSDDESLSLEELIRTLAEFLHSKCRLVYCPRALLRAVSSITGQFNEVDNLFKDLLVDNSLMKESFRWKPSYSARKGLQETAKWWLHSCENVQKG